jgi:hypothetical protein
MTCTFDLTNVTYFLLIQELVEGFDQETAAVVLARYISLKMELEVTSFMHQASKQLLS